MKIDNMVKLLKKQLFIGIVLVIISVCCYFGAFKIRESENSKVPENWNNLIADNNDSEGKYATVTTPYIPYQFGEKEEDGVVSKYYLIIDTNFNYYVVRLTDDTYNDMVNQYDDKGDSFSYDLKGYLYSTPDELKNLVINAFNEESDSGLTMDNYNEYLGKCYLDETETPQDDVIGVLNAVGMIIDVFAGIIIIVFLLNNSRTNKILQKYDKRDIEEEIGKESTTFYKKLKLYVTDKYLVCYANGINVIEYSDIYWTYIEKVRYRGITTGKYVVLITKDKRKVQLTSTFRDEKPLNEVIEKIHNKNEDILVGYSPENQKAFAEFKKNK